VLAPCALNVPAAHGPHDALAGALKRPAAHTAQAASEVCATPLLAFPAAHTVQFAEPCRLYVPAPHVAHVDVSPSAN
jgi:hypothetical protein